MCSCLVKDFLGSVNSISLMKLNVMYYYYISNTSNTVQFFLKSNDSLEISVDRTLPKIIVMIKIDLGMFERI